MKFFFHQFFCPFLRPRHSVFAVSAVIFASGSLLPAQTNWRQVSSGTTANLRSVTFLNGQFIACGDNAGSDAEPLYGLVSSDGEHWRKTPLANLSQIITAGGRLIGIGDSLGDGGVSIPKRGLYASREGFHAVRINSGPEFDSLSVGNNGIWFAHTRYPGGGYFGTWRYSTDLFNALRGPNSDAGISVAFGNGLYLSLLSDGPYAGVSSSVDGIAWPRASAPISGSKLIFGNGRFLSYDTSVRMKSTDNGLSWVPVSGNEYGVWSLTFASGKFAAVSWGKKAMQFSSDGENWKTVRVPAESSMCGIAYGEAGITSVPPVGRWVAVGDKGQIFISENDSEAASAKKLTINPAVQLRWFGETGVTYRIQSSTNMAGWEDEGDLIQGAGAEIVISEPAVSPVRFFRIVPQ